MSALIIVAVAPVESVMVTLSLLKSIGSSLIILSPASAEVLLVPSSNISPLPVSSSPKILSFASIVRFKNGKIKNHWSENPYYWNKPNIFASWFRILSIANKLNN